MKYWVFIGVLLGIFNLAVCSKILGVWSVMTRSHYILGKRLMLTLAEAGHDVTLISPYGENILTKNGSFRSIKFKVNLDQENDVTQLSYLNTNMIDRFTFPLLIYSRMMEDLLTDETVQRLLGPEEKFDAVIVEQFGNDALKALAHHFNAHLIVFSSTFTNEWVNDYVGNPSPTSYVPVIGSSFPLNMSFIQRVHNTMLYVYRRLLTYLYLTNFHDNIRLKYFPNSPTVSEMNSNTSLLLLNSHESIAQSMPMVPNMVQIGGYHVEPPKNIPEDLQKFMDDSSEGVIYFSLGSVLKGNELPSNRRKMFIDTFSKLNQKILWKWDNDTMSGKPENVELRKWIPQSDILAHPNLRLFITHGGILGITEAVYHGVPVLVIPVFGDQVTNGHNVVEAGYGFSLPYYSSEFTQLNMEMMIKDLLENPRYKEAAKERSRLFHDRPMSPKEALNYWVDYVIKTKGARHLRVAGIDLPWYQYYLLDVLMFLLLMAAAPVPVMVLIFKSIKCALNKKEKQL